MLIAQVTDIHIGFDRNNPDEPNRRRFATVLERFAEGRLPPDLLLLTGDLTEHGDVASYEAVAAMVAQSPFPVLPIPGNHDDRQALSAAFPDMPMPDGFINYGVDCNGLRVVMLDTIEAGRQGGAFCETRAEWLRTELAAHAEQPVLIAMHHPPVASGIAWMDPDPAEPWIARFAEAISGHRNIKAIVCGHVHRSITTTFAQVPLIVCASTAPAVALDFKAIDPLRADGRAMIVDKPPGYMLHRWDGATLVSHSAIATDDYVLARYDPRMQPLVSQNLAERP